MKVRCYEAFIDKMSQEISLSGELIEMRPLPGENTQWALGTGDAFLRFVGRMKCCIPVSLHSNEVRVVIQLVALPAKSESYDLESGDLLLWSL